MSGSHGQANKRTAIMFGGVAAGMLAMSFAAVPLYEIFCRVTGFGGTPLRADQASQVVLDETIKVRFDASIDSKLDWEFKPVQREIELRIGESGLAFYRAHNPTDKPISGTATFNVTPLKASPHFMKIDCFCFTEQTLQPGETVEMPVTFFVDPEIRQDHLTEELTGITLSYTFYRMDTEESASAATGKDDDATALN